MLRFAPSAQRAVAALVILTAACADVTSGPGGTGGTGGTGGSGGGTLLPEPVLVSVPVGLAPLSFAAEPPTDSVDAELGAALGEVSGSCISGTCGGFDPADQWSIQPTASGDHRIRLTWASDFNDLDLFLIDSDGALVDGSVEEGTLPETIVTGLTAGAIYVIQVQAFETFGENQSYTLAITSTP